jgi:hypothetical protein
MPAFVLCTDGRLAGGGWGSNDAAIKTHTLGWNFMALMAGHWSTVLDMCLGMARDVQNSREPESKDEIFQTIRDSVARFAALEICPPDVEVETIVTGFISMEPIMFKAGIKNKVPCVSVSHHRAEIGEGAFPASMILNHRGHDPLNTDLPLACYLVYEAKKFSETVDSVGLQTWLKVQTIDDHSGPQEGPASMSATCVDINEAGLQQCEEWRQSYFLQSPTAIRGTFFRRFR